MVVKIIYQSDVVDFLKHPVSKKKLNVFFLSDSIFFITTTHSYILA